MAALAVAVPYSRVLLMRPAAGQIRVLTVDEHQLVQEGLAAVINREEDMTVVAAASTGEEALDCVRRLRPDVVTLDLRLPDMPGDELARKILAEFPATRIVAITSGQSHVEARRAWDSGVRGYLSKAAPRRDLVKAIRKVQAGGSVAPGPEAREVAVRSKGGSLTQREIQVLQLVARGTRTRQVAAQLSIAVETVRMHMKNILSKLAASDRTHAVSIAMMRGVLRLEKAF